MLIHTDTDTVYMETNWIFTCFHLVLINQSIIIISTRLCLTKLPITKLLNDIGSIGPVILVNIYFKCTGHEMHSKIATITEATFGLKSN